jgi:transmembrane sensor
VEHFTTDGDLDLDLIERYFSGALGAAERETFERWMSVHPTRRRAVEDLRGVWTRAGRSEGWDVDGIWQALVVRMRVADSSDVTHPAANMRSISGGLPAHETSARSDRRGGGVWGTQPLRGTSKGQSLRGGGWAAAALSLIVLVIVASWDAGVSHVDHQVARSTLTYTTANGQRATISLPDGSTVALNVGSRLEVPTEYATGVHTVRLVGEGMFTVPRHDGTPFMVLAGVASVRVLGTSFLVRHYATDPLTTVAVREGKVAVRSVVLTAAQQVAVGRDWTSPVQPADPAQFSFARGVLTLDGVRFPEAVVELDRWYDADIRLGNPVLASRHVAGEFADGTIAALAEYLTGTLHVRVVRNGRVLTLMPR